MKNFKKNRDNIIEFIFENIKNKEFQVLDNEILLVVQDINRRNLFGSSVYSENLVKVWEKSTQTIFDKLIIELRKKNLSNSFTKDNAILFKLINDLVKEIYNNINSELEKRAGQQSQITLDYIEGKLQNLKERIIKQWNNEAEINKQISKNKLILSIKSLSINILKWLLNQIGGIVVGVIITYLTVIKLGFK